MRVLIVGGSGYLGAELLRQAQATGHEATGTYATRPGDIAGVDWQALDIRNRADVDALTAALRPHWILNAAYRQADWTTTADGAAHLAAAAATIDARLVQVSSDALFSGAARCYDEGAVPDPITPYGAAKAAAETAVKVLDPAAVIARTSLILGDGGGDGRSVHEERVHALAAGRAEGVLFTDDVRCPVHVADLAAALLELAGSDHAGVHHVVGVDAVSRYELGQLIAHRDGLDAARLRAGRRAAANVPGPLDVRLDCTATQRRLRTRLRGAREFLSRPAMPG